MSIPATTPLVIATAFYEALTADDLGGAAALMADDVVLHVPGTHALAGSHIGVDGIFAFMVQTRALTDDGEHIELLDVLGGARHAAAYCRITAERAGHTPLDNTTVHIVRTEGERIAEIWLHNFDDVAVQEFWS